MSRGTLRSLLPGVVLLAIALVLFYRLVWALDPTSTLQANLGPWPDASEYLDGALHIAEEGRFRIHVAGEEMPSRYPFGFSLLLAGLLELGAAPLEAPFLLNRIAGLLLLLSVFAGLAWRRYPTAAGLAALLLCTRTSFIILCRSPMSEITTLLPVFWAVLLLYRYGEGAPRWTGLLGALLLGLSTCFRLSSVLLFGFPLAALIARNGRQIARLLNDGSRLAVAGAAGMAPVLVYHWQMFGAPWKTGYAFWLNDGHLSQMFGIEFLGRNLSWFLQEMTQSEVIDTVAGIYGEKSLYAPSYVLLAVLSVWALRTRRTAVWLASSAALSGALSMLYVFGYGRPSFPLVALSVPLTALAWIRYWENAYRRRAWMRATVASVLLLVVLIGWPGRRSDSDIGDMFKSHPLNFEPHPHWTVEHLTALGSFGDRERLILTDMNPTYPHALTQGRRVVAPIQDDHDYRHNPRSFVFGAEERRRLFEAVRRASGEVFVATAFAPLENLDDRFPAPQGTRWRILWQNAAGAGVAHLVPNEGGGKDVPDDSAR